MLRIAMVLGLATQISSGPANVSAAQPAISYRAHHSCSPAYVGVLFETCRERGQLPFKIDRRLSNSGVPSSDFEAAVIGAISEWNRAWPGSGGAFIAGSTTTKGLARDGSNVIMWGDPASCQAPGAIAVACLYFEGSSGDARHEITEVDFILNQDFEFLQAAGEDLVLGLATETAGVSLATWIDLQSVITHELGHALGLDDIGNPTTSFPTTLADAGTHTQTMYRWYYPGGTAKRSLEAGDIAGLVFVYLGL